MKSNLSGNYCLPPNKLYKQLTNQSYVVYQTFIYVTTIFLFAY